MSSIDIAWISRPQMEDLATTINPNTVEALAENALSQTARCRDDAKRAGHKQKSPASTRLRTTVLLMSVGLPMAACAPVGPDFVTPKPPIADNYLERKDTPTRETAEERKSWWTIFDDPTLNQLMDIAYAHNLTLVSAGTHVLQARAELGVAIGGFYPQIQQVVGTTNYNRLSRSDAFSITNPPGNFWRSTLGTQAVWELDFWGKFRRGVENADAAYLESIANYDDALVTLFGDVATTYIGIRTIERQIELAQSNIARQRKALSIAQDRFKNGATSRLDVYQAQNVLGSTEARVPQLKIERERGLNALRVLLGMAPQPLDSLLARTKAIPAAPEDVSVGIPADLLRRRPDIRAAELRAAAQSAKIGIAEADLYPSFSLAGSIGLVASSSGGATLGDIFTHKGLAYSFGPSLQWSVLNYGRITNNVRAQDAELQALLVDYKNAVLKAQQEVENGLATFVLSREQMEFLRSSVDAAQNALDLSFLQYQQGLSDFTTVLTAEQNLLVSESNLTTTVGNLSASIADIYRALGGGWEVRAGKDFVPPDTRDEMRDRTDWGDVLPATGSASHTPEGLPSPADRGPTTGAPLW